MAKVRIPTTDLELFAARSFTFSRGHADEEAFLLRVESGFVAFVNRCPHWDVDLDLGFGDPFDKKTGYIRCRNHGALFDKHSGACVAGPCQGRSLEMLPVVLEGDVAVVSVPLPIVF